MRFVSYKDRKNRRQRCTQRVPLTRGLGTQATRLLRSIEDPLLRSLPTRQERYCVAAACFLIKEDIPGTRPTG
jgi:hypothetical protein